MITPASPISSTTNRSMSLADLVPRLDRRGERAGWGSERYALAPREQFQQKAIWPLDRPDAVPAEFVMPVDRHPQHGQLVIDDHARQARVGRPVWVVLAWRPSIEGARSPPASRLEGHGERRARSFIASRALSARVPAPLCHESWARPPREQPTEQSPSS